MRELLSPSRRRRFPTRRVRRRALIRMRARGGRRSIIKGMLRGDERQEHAEEEDGDGRQSMMRRRMGTTGVGA
ncbi:unnamed protein product [Victoria cruziana]